MVIIFFPYLHPYDQLAKYVFVLHNHIQRLTGVKKTCKKEIFTVPLSYERGVKKKRRTTTQGTNFLIKILVLGSSWLLFNSLFLKEIQNFIAFFDIAIANS